MKKLSRAFGKVMRELRTERKLSQEHLALESGLDRTFISMLERGIRQPSLTTLFNLSKTLKCRASEFIARIERELKATSG